MKNSDRFLDAFTLIEKHLRRESGAKYWVPFSQLVSRASKSTPELHRFREDLKELADLRNAIVHDRMNGEVIAEPTEWAVERIEKIAQSITAPPAVIPLFAKQVFTIRGRSKMAEALRIMKQHEFTKLPVIDDHGGYAGLLTANTITRWVASTVDGAPLDLAATTVREALHFAERDSERFVAAHASVFEVFELFRQVESRGKSLEAVLITADGKPSSKILGVVTIADLPQVLEA